MDRPPLTLLLASVVSASLDGDPRRLLAHQSRRHHAPERPDDGTLATVSTLPRVIPMPRRESVPQPTPEPDPAA